MINGHLGPLVCLIQVTDFPKKKHNFILLFFCFAGDSNVNNNCEKSNSDNEEGKCSETGSCDLNTVMLQALSVLKFNKELSGNILLKEIRKRIGKERCDHIMHEINKSISEGGQNYNCLNNSLTEHERNLVPMICMYLAC